MSDSGKLMQVDKSRPKDVLQYCLIRDTIANEKMVVLNEENRFFGGRHVTTNLSICQYIRGEYRIFGPARSEGSERKHNYAKHELKTKWKSENRMDWYAAPELVSPGLAEMFGMIHY